MSNIEEMKQKIPPAPGGCVDHRPTAVYTHPVFGWTVVQCKTCGAGDCRACQGTTAMSWQKERGGGGFELRALPIYGRVWPGSDNRWRAARRPEPYNAKTPGWENAPTTFEDKAAACAWVEGS